MLIVVFLLALGAATYVVDYVVLRYRIASQKSAFGQVMVTQYFATSLKNGHTEYDFQQPQNVTCVNALYPHMGMQPCWYLSRHREKRTDLMVLLF